MGKHHRPVSAIELWKFLDDLGIESGRNGGSTQTAIFQDGPVKLPAPTKKAEVSDRDLNRVARSLDTDRAGLLSALDRPTVSAGKIAGKVAEKPPVGHSKGDVALLANDLRARLNSVATFHATGVHSPSVYQRACVALSEALTVVDALPPHAGDGYVAPDDTGYRPSSPDSITTGVGRATGLTATAAVGRKTFTKWQHEERSA